MDSLELFVSEHFIGYKITNKVGKNCILTPLNTSQEMSEILFYGIKWQYCGKMKFRVVS